MRRFLILSVALLSAMVLVAAVPSLAAGIDVLSTNPTSAAGWTNTSDVEIATGEFEGWTIYQTSTDGGQTWSAQVSGGTPALIPLTLGTEDGIWNIGAHFWRWDGTYTYSEYRYDTILLDTVRPLLKSHMSKAVYKRSQRPAVHYYVEDVSGVKTSAVVKRKGTNAGSSRSGAYRASWYWRSLPLFAKTSSTYFKSGTYSVVVATRDRAGNVKTKSLKFSVR